MTVLDQLVKLLAKLPGIGPKSASRMAFYLIKTDRDYNVKLSTAIAEIQDKIFPCSICCSYTEQDPCPICSDPHRNRALLCVVEQPQDVLTITASGAYE